MPNNLKKIPQITGNLKIPIYLCKGMQVGYAKGVVRGITLIDSAIHYGISDYQEEELHQYDIVKINGIMSHNIEYLKTKGYSYVNGRLFFNKDIRLRFKLKI